MTENRGPWGAGRGKRCGVVSMQYFLYKLVTGRFCSPSRRHLNTTNSIFWMSSFFFLFFYSTLFVRSVQVRRTTAVPLIRKEMTFFGGKFAIWLANEINVACCKQFKDRQSGTKISLNFLQMYEFKKKKKNFLLKTFLTRKILLH